MQHYGKKMAITWSSHCFVRNLAERTRLLWVQWPKCWGKNRHLSIYFQISKQDVWCQRRCQTNRSFIWLPTCCWLFWQLTTVKVTQVRIWFWIRIVIWNQFLLLQTFLIVSNIDDMTTCSSNIHFYLTNELLNPAFELNK